MQRGCCVAGHVDGNVRKGLNLQRSHSQQHKWRSNSGEDGSKAVKKKT